MEYLCQTEMDTKHFAEKLAERLKVDHQLTAKIYLSGDLGAGKTTFSRYFLEAIGVTETIKSPTYTIVESYNVDTHKFLHIDLYRIEAVDIYDLGFLEEDDALWLIEWPEKGEGVLPKADIYMRLEHIDDGVKFSITGIEI